MRKLAAIIGITVLTLAFSVPAMAYTSISPTTDPDTTKKTTGTQESDRQSPDTGEAPIVLGLGTVAAISAAGIVVVGRKKRV